MYRLISVSIRRKTITYLFAGLLSGVSGLFGETGPLHMEIGLFRATEDESRVEVYLGVERKAIRYERSQNRFKSRLAAVVGILR